jgi:hypothetical protein
LLTPPEKPNQEPTTTTTATPHTSSPSNPPATSVPTTSKHPNTNTNTPHHHHHHLLLHSPNEDEEPPPPSYSIFALTDIKSRLPLLFLNQSLHLITLITLTQIILGVTTGILLNLPGVGASGGAILLLIPWIYNIASALRRFIRIARTIHLLSTLKYSSSSSSSSSSPLSNNPSSSNSTIRMQEKLPDITASESWERTTTRQGKVCYVHHGHRKTMWSVPVSSRSNTEGGAGAGGGGGGGGIHGNGTVEGTSP